MLPNHFVILWDNIPVALDSDSGGYPYKTQHPGNIKYWVTSEEAQRYINEFQNSPSYGFFTRVKIVEIQFRIVG